MEDRHEDSLDHAAAGGGDYRARGKRHAGRSAGGRLGRCPDARHGVRVRHGRGRSPVHGGPRVHPERGPADAVHGVHAGRPLSSRGALPRPLRDFGSGARTRVGNATADAERGRQPQSGAFAAGDKRRRGPSRARRRRRAAGGARRNGVLTLRRAVSGRARPRYRRADLHALPRRELPLVPAVPPGGVGGGHRQDARQGAGEPAGPLLRRRHHLLPRCATGLCPGRPRDPARLSGRALRARRAAASHPRRAADAGRREGARQGAVHRVLPAGGRAGRGRQRAGVRRPVRQLRRAPRRPGRAVRPARQRVADGPRLPAPAGEAGSPYRRVHGLRPAGPQERHPRGQHRPGGHHLGPRAPRRPVPGGEAAAGIRPDDGALGALDRDGPGQRRA